MITAPAYSLVLLGTPTYPLYLKGGSITLDASAAPHVQATFDIARVDGVVDEALDPRNSPRVEFTVTSGSVTRVFNLGVRSRPIAYGDAGYSITAASDEAVLEDQGPLIDLNYGYAAPSGRDVVNEILNQVSPGTALEPGPDFTITGEAADALIWRAGQSALDFLQPLVQAYGFRLVCDELQQWTLRDENYTVTGGVVIRYGINMVDADETIDREAGLWFDAAVARYRWTDPSGTLQEAYDSYSLVPLYTRLRTFDKETAFPGPGFAQYAVRRAQGRGREMSATAVADWRAQAEQAIEITVPDAPIQTGISSSVSFDLERDEMTVTTRTVETSEYAYILGPIGASYNDVPVGVDYDSFDWSVV